MSVRLASTIASPPGGGGGCNLCPVVVAESVQAWLGPCLGLVFGGSRPWYLLSGQRLVRGSARVVLGFREPYELR